MNSLAAPPQRRAQRRLLRERRAALSAAERAAAARAISRHIAASRWLAHGRRIGIYAAHGSELDTAALRALAHRRGCHVYLPRIVHYRHRQLRFYRDDIGTGNAIGTGAVASRFPGSRPGGAAIRSCRPDTGGAIVRPPGIARRNRHGIIEPVPGAALDVRWLSLLFLPLLGFDARGTRLGSGHGYFDRALQFRHHRVQRRPLLVGLGFACQQLTYIERQPHDVPLDAVVTEAGIHFFDRHFFDAEDSP